MSRFDKAFVNITPDMGHAIMLQAFDGAHLQTVSYQKVEDPTDSITRLLLTGKMESMVHPFACDFFHLTDLEPVEYSFLLQGKNSDGTALSLSFKETPKKSVETPELVSLIGMESQLKAEIKLKTENEGGTVVFFLVNAEGAITEYRHQVDYVSLEEVHEVIISNDILPHGQTFEVSFLLEAERGPTAMTTPLLITMANKPDRIDVAKTQMGDELIVNRPNDYSAEFKLDIEASKFSVVDIDDSDAVDSLLSTNSSTNHQQATNVGGWNSAYGGRLRFIAHDWSSQLIGALALYWDGSEWVRGGKVTSLGARQNNGDWPVYFDVDTRDFSQTLVFVQPVIKLDAVLSQVVPAFTGNNGTEHYIRASALANMGEYVSVRARWTNEDGSSAWSSDIVLRYFTHQHGPSFNQDLKVIPSIADKILSFKVAGRNANSGLKVIGAIGGDLESAIVEYANKLDGRIVSSFPADQDLSQVTESLSISTSLTYVTELYQPEDRANFQSSLNIPRIEASDVSISATEVLTQEGGQVEFTFDDQSTYHDGAKRTSVTINETAISKQDFIPANKSGSTPFQLNSVQYSLPAASIVATTSMDALSGISDWQSLPIKQVEVFGKDLKLNGPTAVGDFFINFDLSVKLDEMTYSSWVEKTAQEKADTIAELNARYGETDWYTIPTVETLHNVPLKYEDGELYFVELLGSSWRMYYESDTVERTNMSGVVSNGQLNLPEFGGKKIWSTTTLYNGIQAPVALAEGTEFPARKFILDRTVHTHTAVSPPQKSKIVISANGLTGQVTGVITPGSTGNQTLDYRQVRYDDGTHTSQTPYIVEAGPGVIVKGIVWDNYRYTKADGSIHAHVILSEASNEAHGTTAPILGTVSISGKQLSIPYKSGGKIGENNKLSLFVFAHDEDVSPADVTSGRGTFHEIKSITPASLTAEVTYAADFSHFSSAISKYMVVLSRASDGSAASSDGM